MKKLLIIFLFPIFGHAAVEFDLRKGVDMTTTNRITASLMNQLVDSGTISATNKGGIIRQSTTPNTADNPRYTNFIFISNAVGTVTAPVIMLWNGTGWIPFTAAAGSISGTSIIDSSIPAGKFTGSAIYGTNIAGNTVQGTNIADGAISGDKIAGSGIWQGKFFPGAITGADITNRSISNINIRANSLTSNEMAAASIPTPMLSDGAVTTAKIAVTNVDRTVIRADAVGSLQITNGGVASNNIAPFAINTIHHSTNMPTFYAFGCVTNTSGVGAAFLQSGVNVSVARHGSVAGTFIVTFVNPPVDALYMVSGSVADITENAFIIVTNKTATSFEIRSMDAGGSLADNNVVMFQVIR